MLWFFPTSFFSYCRFDPVWFRSVFALHPFTGTSSDYAARSNMLEEALLMLVSPPSVLFLFLAPCIANSRWSSTRLLSTGDGRRAADRDCQRRAERILLVVVFLLFFRGENRFWSRSRATQCVGCSRYKNSQITTLKVRGRWR